LEIALFYLASIETAYFRSFVASVSIAEKYGMQCLYFACRTLQVGAEITQRIGNFVARLIFHRLLIAR
jgi:hypothetical protein